MPGAWSRGSGDSRSRQSGTCAEPVSVLQGGRMMSRMAVLAALALASDATPPDRFTVVLLPDTQFYSLRDPITYQKQAEWIVDHRDALNIKFVIHLGDITDDNALDESTPKWLQEWSPSNQ